MSEHMQIKGGAGPFEAAALAAAVAHVLEREKMAMQRRPDAANRPPAWVRAGWSPSPDDPLAIITPDHRGDPI